MSNASKVINPPGVSSVKTIPTWVGSFPRIPESKEKVILSGCHKLFPFNPEPSIIPSSASTESAAKEELRDP